MRADQLIVARGLAPTRAAAQRLIAHGGVRWRAAAAAWALPRKAGEDLPDDCRLEIVDDAEIRFVSRGGLKLAAALDRTALDVAGRAALDLGQSTGGFTDVLLQRGAARVVGVDVGHGQLHPRLAADPRVVCVEGVNARALDSAAVDAARPPHGFDVVVCDLSFISLTLVLPTVARQLAERGDALLLVKPQFELQPADIGRGGIVRSDAAHERVETRVCGAVAASGLGVIDYFPSAIAGGDGNREFFVHARHRAEPDRP